MKLINTFHCCCMLMFCVLSAAQAGGSLMREEIESVVSQNSALWTFLTSTLDIKDGGTGGRIGSDNNLKLAGTRILPYHLRAKPKGTEGPYIYEIELQGTITYFDKRGQKTSLKSAADVKMTFSGITLRKLTREEQEQ